MQRSKINRFGLADLFDLILIEGEVGFGKPDPRVYERALESLGVAAGDTWMVGDNLEWDVAEPQRQGILRHLDRCPRRRTAAWSLGATGSNHSKAL